MKKARARAARAIPMAMGMVGEEEGDGGKTMAMVSRVAGKRTATVDKEGNSDEDERDRQGGGE